MKVTPVIGLEIHLQLNNKSKMFCSCSADYFGKEPNTYTCPVCLGLPGALPVINKEAMDKTILMVLALNCDVNTTTFFERKNYFYHDLPKGFQLSQKKFPLGVGGYLEIGGKKFDLWEIHLEEDTAKSIHQGGDTLVDFNKSGISLLELVSAPCFTSIEELDMFAQEIRRIARALGISNCDMEKGQMRFEANISVKENGITSLPNYRVEVKNINSFKFLRDAVAYEIQRQTDLLENGEDAAQETRGWDPKSRKTFVQRTKEQTHDYRFFPEPDLPSIQLSDSEVDNLQKQLPILPEEKKQKLISAGVSVNVAQTIAHKPSLARYDLESLKHIVTISGCSLPSVSKAVVNRSGEFNKCTFDEIGLSLKEETTGIISAMDILEKVVAGVLESNQLAVEDYHKGKKSSLQFLLGQVMKKTKGKANPQIAIEILKKLLEK